MKAAVLALLVAVPAAWAQTQWVPPPGAERDKAITDGAWEAPKDIMKRAAAMQEKSGDVPGSKKTWEMGKHVGNAMSATKGVVGMVEGGNRAGVEGVLREGAAAVWDWAKDEALEKGIQYGVKRMPAPVGAALVLEATYEGTHYLGTKLIRDNKALGEYMGLNGTWGDAVADRYVQETPEWSKKLLIEGYDPDRNRAVLSGPVPNQARRDMFNRIAAENAEQERQRQAAAAAAAANSTPVSSSTSDDGSAAFATFMQGVLQQYQQNQLNRTPVVAGGNSGAAANSCQLDPKTGCHYGHDEKSHPGGCKQCGGSSAR